jgi:DNA-binding NtrC family response regulator
LFGHEKGAFTGAVARKPGLVDIAQGGTLFLDEIGDVPLAMQVKLLRLIESGTYRRVGSVETLHANFRLVAATHKPLEEMMTSGAFRADLYYRLSTFPIRLPPLRERVEDIGLLANSFLQRRDPAKRLVIDDEALVCLQRYAWPGNIRELRNALDRASLFADDGVIRTHHLPPAITAHTPGLPTAAGDQRSLQQMAATFKGTRSELAKYLGLSERTLYRRLREEG